MPNPEVDLATSYDTALGTATLGTNLFHGPVRAPEDGYPAQAAFCWESGGPAAEPFNGQATRLVRAQVRVHARGNKDDYNAGKVWADSLFDSGEHAVVAGYINVRNLEAAPSYLGADESGRHRWQWTVELLYEG